MTKVKDADRVIGMLLFVASALLIYPAYVFERWTWTLVGVAVSGAYWAGIKVGRASRR